MNGPLHAAAGLGAAIATGWLWPSWMAHGGLVVPAAVYVGSIAPDRLELGLIPHRTLTHWPLGWLVFVMVLYILSNSTVVVLGAAGFVAGCLIHISGDALTPMGVPLWQPFRRYTLAGGEQHKHRNGVLWASAFWMPVIVCLIWG